MTMHWPRRRIAWRSRTVTRAGAPPVAARSAAMPRPSGLPASILVDGGARPASAAAPLPGREWSGQRAMLYGTDYRSASERDLPRLVRRFRRDVMLLFARPQEVIAAGFI